MMIPIRAPKVLALACVLTCLLAGALGCGQGTAEEVAEQPRSKPVEIETLTAERFTSWVRVPGIVEAKSSMALSFRVAGFVARFAVAEGERADAGEVIAELDPRDHEREMKLASAAVERAAANLAETRAALCLPPSAGR